ncbi:MAG: response regulator, partial [Planctomycetaceae bacterium]|nr:response regulator [Planctomycetaceae bacterium]
MYKIDETRNRRILVIDDNEAIHEDFRKVLANRKPNAASDSYAAFFGEQAETSNEVSFEVDTASQGREGLEKVRQSIQDNRPYAMAFVDIRMPPGWDGIETVKYLWEVDPNLLVVFCTAYNDYNWTEMSRQLGCMDRWLIIKKPFDDVDIRQLATSRTEKWYLSQKTSQELSKLQLTVGTTNRQLEAFRKAVDAAGIVAVTNA